MGADDHISSVREASPTMLNKPSDEATIARFGKKQQFKVGPMV